MNLVQNKLNDMGNKSEVDATGFSNKGNIPVRPINEGPAPQAERYDMNHAERGVAIIFNHMHFNIHHCPTRQGTNKDRDDLEKLFGKLRFNVKSYNDLTVQEVKTVLASTATADHSQADCLVVIVLSHGDTKKIYAKDTYYSTNLLWLYFDGIHAPTLVGKPKLFFIQACRGEAVDRGVKLKYHPGTEVDSTPKHEDRFYMIPIMADFLMMYSTVEDHLSWRNPLAGSYFIQSLIRQLSAHSDRKDLLTILTYVNREVATGYSLEMERNGIPSYGHKQMCSIVSMLTREIHFN